MTRSHPDDEARVMRCTLSGHPAPRSLGSSITIHPLPHRHPQERARAHRRPWASGAMSWPSSFHKGSPTLGALPTEPTRAGPPEGCCL